MSSQFTLFGEEFYISNERQSYNMLYRNFSKLAEDFSQKFIELYNENYRNIEDVINNSFDHGNQYIFIGIQEAVKILISYGIYYIDEESFTENYYLKKNYYLFQEHYESIKDKYLEITLDQQRLDEYRTARRQGRGRIVGGGFGLAGAAKGIVTAGALNMASGAVHGTFNLMGKMMSTVASNMAMSKIYNDTGTLNTLIEGLYYSILNIHYPLVTILNKDKGFNIHNVTNKDKEKAKSIYNNLIKHNFPIEQKKQIIIELLSLNPYESTYYEYVIDNFKGYGTEIDKISVFFGINIMSYKLKSIEELYNKLDFGSEIKAIESRKSIKSKLETYDICDTSILREIDLKIENYRNKRTFEGILFSNEKECKNAEFLHNEFIETKNIEYASETELNILKNEFIDGIYDKLPTKTIIINIINEKLDILDRKKRTLFGVEYSSIEECEFAKNEFEEVKKIASVCNFSDEESLIKTKEELQKRIKTGVANQIIKKIDQELNLIAQNKRTVFGIIFDNDEDANNAKEEYNFLYTKYNNLSGNNSKEIKKAIKYVEENHKSQIGTVFKKTLVNQLEKLAIRTIRNLQIDNINQHIYDIEIKDENKKNDFIKFLKENVSLSKNENAIIYFNNSNQRKSLEGFIISNKSIHYFNLGKRGTILLDNIKSIDLSNDLIIINEKIIININSITKSNRQTFCNLLIALVSMLKKEI